MNMKNNSNIISKILTVFILSVTIVSCSEDAMDKVNLDKNHSTSVPSKYVIADIITSTAFNNVGGDFNTYLSVYNEQTVGVDNQMYNTEHRLNQPSAASTFDNPWITTYTTLKNARIVIAKCSATGSEKGNDVTKGIAEVLAALNSGLLADLFGDTPWSQAALVDASGSPLYLTPKIDTQSDIYKGINQYLDDAIVDLQKSDLTPVGGYDLLYGGGAAGAAKWLKLAYGLKARYLMHTLNKSANKATDLNTIISYLDKSFTSVNDQAAFNIYDANNINPTFDFQWSRDGLGVSQSMSDKLAARNDPRSRRVYIDPNSGKQLTGVSDAAFNPAPNGTNDQVKFTYSYTVYFYAQTAPTMLMSYHEALFLRAEALCRLNRATDALPILKSAVAAAIANTEVSVSAAMNAPTVISAGAGLISKTAAITPAEAGTFFDTQIAPLFTLNPLQETMIQKYIAFWGASGESTESYTDIRRMKALGENFITLANPLNAQGKYPLRLAYGTSDTTTNPAVEAAYGDGTYVYTIPVWWAGGVR